MFLAVAVLAIGATSCKKCKDCKAYAGDDSNGNATYGTTTQEFCKDALDAAESQTGPNEDLTKTINYWSCN